MTSDLPTVGFAGAGQLGSAIITRLIEQGYLLKVWNRTPQVVEPLELIGAQRVESPSDLARDCDLIMTCVTDTNAVQEIVFGSNGLAKTGRERQLYIDMSTIDAAKSRKMAALLKQETGMRWIDAPISGGASAAKLGSMTIMVGGDLEDFRSASPIWKALSSQCTLFGPSGSGQSAKMISQVLVLGGFALVAEATALAGDAGINASLIPKALAGGRADSFLLQEAMPEMIAPTGNALGKNSNNLKDLEMIHDLAKTVGTPMPVIATITELNRKLMRMGLGDECSSTIIRLHKK